MSKFIFFQRRDTGWYTKKLKFINNKKATTFNTIQPKASKLSSECFADILKLLVNELVSTGKSLQILNK